MRFLQTAGFSDVNKPIMPVCRGVTEVSALDNALSCKEAIENPQSLQVNLIYTEPD